jgi:hypothetical protein
MAAGFRAEGLDRPVEDSGQLVASECREVAQG